MVFGRRVKPGFRQRVRSLFWPQSGLKRSARYIVKRVARLNASPHAIAAGFAAGAAASFTPFLGFHFLLAFTIAWAVRGNLVASAFGTAVGNPLTFPLIFTATYETGHYIRGLFRPVTPPAGDAAAHGQAVIEQGFFSGGFDALWPVVATMCIGAIPLGVVAFAIFYFLMRSLVSALQHARRSRRAHRQAARRAQVRETRRSNSGGLPADA